MIEKVKKLTKQILVNTSPVKFLLRIRRSIINHNDQEYEKLVKYLYIYLLNRTPSSQEIKDHLKSVKSPSSLLESFINSDEFSAREVNINKSTVDLRSYIGGSAYLLGESYPIDLTILLPWYEEAAKELIGQLNQFRFDSDKINVLSKPLPPIGEDYWVTIITSLYKGEKYIQTFLDNITNQTIFDKCQLFIVDANSPQDEYKEIKKYMDIFPNNITYQRLGKTIGIYEAWNLAINNSSSEFITNANVDDLHRSDALELKVEALRNNPKVDVVYSDVYYSFLENSPFDVIEKCGLRTNLPTANKFNLLMFNSPHNSPLWRRSLHDKIGLFDPTYQSAGDMELWLRAAFSDCLFMKIEEPVVAYYHNPNGVSTRPNSLGSPEGGKVIEIYRNLISKRK